MALAKQADRLSSHRLRYLDATNGVTVRMIRERARAHFATYREGEVQGGGPGILVVDYLQRIARAVKFLDETCKRDELREVVTKVANDLRALAVELDCSVIAIAAQNRGGYERGSNGAMASAKESGDIEYTCDVLMALSEDKSANRVPPANQTAIMLHVDKNRQGQRGKALALNFWPDRQQFTEVE